MVDTVAAKHHRSFEILYVTTREGILRKMSVLPGSSTLCLLEELHLVAPKSNQRITALKLLSSQVGLCGTFCSLLTVFCEQLFLVMIVHWNFCIFAGGVVCEHKAPHLQNPRAEVPQVHHQRVSFRLPFPN